MVPKGGIIQWSGAIANIPAGWQLCDGTNGTPDLRDRFVVGAGDDFEVDDTGGNDQHSHGFTGDGHLHGNGGIVNCAGSGPAVNWDGLQPSASAPAAGETDDKFLLPPFYSLAYIQRMV